MSETKLEGREETLVDNDLSLFPDGGREAYTVVAGACMGLTSVFGVVNSVGAIQAYISEHQLKAVRTSTVSWIFALYVFAVFASNVLCGCYFDRNGCRTAKYLGIILSVVGIFCLAECKEVYQFILCLSLLYGVGSGILMTCLISSVSTWFNRRRAHATAIASIGGSIGGIVFPIMLRKLYSEVGYAWAIRTLAFIITACLVLSTVLTRENAAVMKYQREKLPWRKTLQIYVRYSLDLGSLKDCKFLFCTLGCCFAENGLIVTTTYFPSYAISKGVPESTSYALIAIINGCGILGRCSGYIADRFTGRFMIITICLLLMTLLSLVMWLPFGHSLKVLYAFSALFGAVCSSILSLVPVAMSQICRTEDFGKRFGLMYLMTALASLAVMPAGGAIIGNGGAKQYDNFIIYCSVLTFSAATSYITSRFFAVGTKRVKF
ncbi:hypothetical protein ACU8KH_03236 [Lachancea thermotolerans]